MDELRKILPTVASIFLILLGIVLLSYQYSRPRGGAIVLPGGVTYLGETPPPPPPPTPTVNRFTASDSDSWITKKGAIYPYSFSVPESLPLTSFLTDQFDAYAITWGGADPGTNVLIGIEDLTNDKKRAPYVNKKKKDYIESFWAKQYNLIGTEIIEEFTSKNGLTGFKVKFKTTSGSSPYDDVFFEVPKKPNLIIHLSNALLSPSVFDRIVESVKWSL